GRWPADGPQIRVRSPAGEYADRGVRFLRIATGILQGAPGTFEKQPMLRVRQLRFFGMHAKERGIKEIGVLEDGAGFDEIGGLARRTASGGGQLFLIEKRNGFRALTKVAPELIQCRRFREPAIHADDGDSGVGLGSLAHRACAVAVRPVDSGSPLSRGSFPWLKNWASALTLEY